MSSRYSIPYKIKFKFIIGRTGCNLQRASRHIRNVDTLDGLIKSCLAELELMMLPMEPASTKRQVLATDGSNSRNVFVVHGREQAIAESVARLLEKLELHPIILHEQPNMGRTVIEKFEANADVSINLAARP